MGDGVEVGGVSFSIAVDLASFLKNLEQAERLAKDHAARMQQILGNVGTGGASGGGGSVGGSSSGGGYSSAPYNNVGGASSGSSASYSSSSPSSRGPDRSAGLSALDKIQKNRVSDYVRQGYDREMAEHYVRGSITGAEFLSTRGGGGPANSADALARAQAIRDRLGPLTPTGAAGVGGASGPYSPSQAFATLQRSRNPQLAATETPDLNDPAVQSRLYAARRQQDALMDRVNRARTREVDRAFREYSQRDRANMQAEAGLQRQFDRQGTTEDIAPENDQRLQARAYQTRRRQESVYARAMRDNQSDAENEARRSGAAFSSLSGRLNAPRGFSVPAAFQGAYQRDDGTEGKMLANAGSGGSGGGSGGSGGSNGFFSFLFGNTGETQTRSLLRAGAALTGVGLGINIAAGAARLLHDALAGAAQDAIQLEQSSRNIGIAYGPQSGLGNLGNLPGRGTQAESQQAAASLAPLAAQYGFTTTQVTQLVTAERELARIHGTDLPQAAQALQSVMAGNLQAGQALDLQLTDQYGILRNVGLTWEQLEQAEGPAQARQTLLAAVQADVNRQLDNSSQSTDRLGRALDSAGQAWDKFKNNVAKGVYIPVTVAVEQVAQLLGSPTTPAPSAQSTGAAGYRQPSVAPPGAGYIPGVSAPPAPAAGTREAAVAQAQRIVDDQSGATQARAEAAAAQAAADQARELAFQRNQSHLQSGINDQRNSPPVLSPEQANAQIQADKTAQRNAADFDQRRVAGLLQQEAQARISILNEQATQRQLAQQDQLNALATQRIDLENQIAPLLLQQQGIQDAINIGTQQNLDLTKARLEAQRAQVLTGSALETNTFQSNQAMLRAQSSIVSLIRGQTPKYDFGTQIGVAYGAALDRPDIALADTEAQHSLNLATVATNIDQITKAIAVIPLEQEQQILERSVDVYQLQLSAANASTDVINRALEFANILAAPDRIQAEKDLSNAMIADAKAMQDQARIQLDQNASNANPIIINVNVGALGSGAITPQVADQIDRIGQVTQTAVLEALGRSNINNLPRTDPNIAGAR